MERDILVRALERHRFNRTAAGASLGLSLRQMRYRMARLGVVVDGDGIGAEGAMTSARRWLRRRLARGGAPLRCRPTAARGRPARRSSWR